MTVYLYHPLTGEFLGSQECQKSPLESDVWLIPPGSTTIKPPKPGEHQNAFFDGSSWVIKTDWRGTKVWNKKNATEKIISEIGIELSNEFTLIDPTGIEYPLYDEKIGWIVDEDKRLASAASLIRAQRSLLIRSAQDRIDRHVNELADGDAPTDNDVTIADVRKYIKTLREITNQKGFPYTVNWPKEVSETGR